MDLASKNPSGGLNCDARHNARTFLRTRRPPSVLSSPTVSGNARPSAGRHREGPDPLEHREGCGNSIRIRPPACIHGVARPNDPAV
jgi:hypothetical protein